MRVRKDPAGLGAGHTSGEKEGGVPFTATLTHALPLWLPGERRVIKPKTTSMRDRDTYIDTIGHGSLNASHEDRRRTKQTW